MKLSAKTSKRYFTLAALSLLAACNQPKAEKEIDNGMDDTKTEQTNGPRLTMAGNIGEVGVDESIDAARKLVAERRDMVNAKRKNDSIQLSKREKMFAYQLGVPMKTTKLVLEAYERLSDTKNVFALKRSKKEYILVKYDGKSESQVDNELESYIELHADEVIGEIKKVDLMALCGKRKKPILSAKLKKRKDETEVECLTCD